MTASLEMAPSIAVTASPSTTSMTFMLPSRDGSVLAGLGCFVGFAFAVVGFSRSTFRDARVPARLVGKNPLFFGCGCPKRAMRVTLTDSWDPARARRREATSLFCIECTALVVLPQLITVAGIGFRRRSCLVSTVLFRRIALRHASARFVPHTSGNEGNSQLTGHLRERA